MRLIDADALIDTLGISDEDIIFEGILADAPTIDAVRHGRWMEATREDPCYYVCSICGKMVDIEENYCPNCGAKMDLLVSGTAADNRKDG